MRLIQTTTLFIAGITFIVFDELLKSIEEASQAVDRQREKVNKRFTSSDLKRQAFIK